MGCRSWREADFSFLCVRAALIEAISVRTPFLRLSFCLRPGQRELRHGRGRLRRPDRLRRLSARRVLRLLHASMPHANVGRQQDQQTEVEWDQTEVMDCPVCSPHTVPSSVSWLRGAYLCTYVQYFFLHSNALDASRHHRSSMLICIHALSGLRKIYILDYLAPCGERFIP
jgi:hypothetical protein